MCAWDSVIKYLFVYSCVLILWNMSKYLCKLPFARHSIIFSFFFFFCVPFLCYWMSHLLQFSTRGRYSFRSHTHWHWFAPSPSVDPDIFSGFIIFGAAKQHDWPNSSHLQPILTKMPHKIVKSDNRPKMFFPFSSSFTCSSHKHLAGANDCIFN